MARRRRLKFDEKFGISCSCCIFVDVNDDKNRETAIQTFTAFLQQRGLRKTPERFTILAAVMTLQGHFTVEQVRVAADSGDMHVSRGTVYNTIQLLVDSGLVRRHRFGSHAPVYEVVHGVRSNHHHLVCRVCGKVREVSDVQIERQIKSRHFDTFHTDYYTLSIYGVCSRCQRRGRRSHTAQK